MLNVSEISDFIKKSALQLGFDDCGIAKVEKLQSDENYLKTWLNKGYNASMQYMQNNFAMRLNPAIIVPNAKSVVSLLMSYNSNFEQPSGLPKIARYAYACDYHKIIRKKLKQLLQNIQSKYPEVEGRAFVDSAPLLERAWAVRAGLGWIGKSSAFISPRFGSFVFLAEIVLTTDCEYDLSFGRNPCGACNRCMANCPNFAIETPHVINANKCISFQTIENKGEIAAPTHGWIFGCDRCLQVCPFNKHAEKPEHSEFLPNEKIVNMTLDDWKNLTEPDFEKTFLHSPIKRAKYAGLQRNLQKILDENNS